jgi:hypothetical protein
MPSSLFSDPGVKPDDSQAAPKPQFDRRRIALKLIQQMREAGYNCELVDPLKDRQ